MHSFFVRYIWDSEHPNTFQQFCPFIIHIILDRVSWLLHFLEYCYSFFRIILPIPYKTVLFKASTINIKFENGCVMGEDDNEHTITMSYSGSMTAKKKKK